MSYDWRVRLAAERPRPNEVATNLAAVFIDDDSLRLVNQAWGYTWPWPRHLHGRLVRRLQEAGASAIGFDILFQEVHPESSSTDVHLQEGVVMGSDNFLSWQLRRSGNCVLAAFGGESVDGRWEAILPNDAFRSNAWAVAHVTSTTDADGILRRAKAFHDDPAHGRFWHMGIVMAAKHLGLDLEHAEVDPFQIKLCSPSGLERVIPIDEEGNFYINWVLQWNDPRILKESFESASGLVRDANAYSAGIGRQEKRWNGKLAFVGSIGSGNNISDLGATPLSKETYLVSNHWNVANSVLTGQFIVPPSLTLEIASVLILGLLSAAVTWKLRAPWPSLVVFLTAGCYLALSAITFVQGRVWLPVVLPLSGGLIFVHVCLVTYQVLFEQKEKRHIRQVFAKLVSPEVVSELIEAESLHLGGARRRVTVMFSDVRGFTEMTDSKQEEAAEYAKRENLEAEDAEVFFDMQARETLNTVNEYLAVIADEVKKHKGTLDKYIGDCVMAFWGAPLANEHHAVSCVRAAIDAQRAIYRLNKSRAAENTRRQGENRWLQSTGHHPRPLLPLLALGTGISTGNAIVGLMGSADHIFNYTVFGRDVNLASRLEAVSGRGRIIIGEECYRDLQRFDPFLASTCAELDPVTVKGIRNSVRIFEVPWKESEESAPTLPLPQALPRKHEALDTGVTSSAA